MKSLLLPCALGAMALAATAQTPLTTTRVASGLSQPLFVTSFPTDPDRLYVVEQRGEIVVVEDEVQISTFIDLTQVSQSSNERGLLGFAFDPDYVTNGRFYVHYTSQPDGHATVVEEYTVSDPTADVANVTNVRTIFGPANQPFSNHNGGSLEFGPDGKLYLFLGDGGSANDPACRAQNPLNHLGKIHRFDPDIAAPFVPADNPFVGDPTTLDSIWALGMRNPFRASFDRETGDLYIGDVGQSGKEEISVEPAGSPGGLNFGWKIMEGLNCFSTNNCDPNVPACNSPALTDPIQQYNTNFTNCAIIGGYVYRGDAIPDLDGTYFYGDHCSANVWSIVYTGSPLPPITARNELEAGLGAITSFGEDADGELYIVDRGGFNTGEVYKIVPAVPFVGLGGALAGGLGEPVLTGDGPLTAGSTITLALTNAAPSSSASLFIGFSQLDAPFKGGTLVPTPDILIPGLPTDGSGELVLSSTWPAGVPSGTELFYQHWIDDPSGPKGLTASNGLVSTTP